MPNPSTYNLRTIRAGLCLLTACLILVPNSAITAIREPGEKPEVKWARGIVEAFVEGIFHGDEAVLGLLSPELARAYTDTTLLYRKFYDYASLKISTHQMAPDQTEVVFQGILRPRSKGGQAGRITIRVAKESAGRWSIRLISIRPDIRKTKRKTKGNEEN